MSEPKRTGLLQLLRESSGSQFVIPVYQRNYTWTAEKDVKRYLADLENVLNGSYKNHFMGIIIYLEKSIDFSSRELSIIDGQQRLTTTFLILYVVKKLFENNGEIEKVDQLVGQYLTNLYHSDKIKYKLKPLISDDDVYKCIIEDRFEEITDTDSNVYKNYNYILKAINDLLGKGYSCNDILMALDKLYVVSVPISEEDNAQKIFESINSTGEKLTAADLIRNYLLMDLQSDIQEKYYKNYWKIIEKNVSQDSKTLEMFFRIYLSIKTYVLVSKTNVYREFVSWIESGKFEVKDVFEELVEYSKIFSELMIDDIKDKRLCESIIDFRKINSDVPLGIVMEFYKLFKHNVIDSEQLKNAVLSINSYMIRRSICDMNSQNISKLFPSVLKKIKDKCGNDFTGMVDCLNQEIVGNNINTSGSFMPTDKQMMEMLHSANVYKRPALRIILDRIELLDNPAPVDLSKLSIEHLMPQSPTEEWLAELDTDEENYLYNLHRLGNLTLASKSDNSKMGNLMWDYKNEILKDTAHLTLNIELLKVKKWNLDQIENRTIRLIEKICEIYPYPDVKTSVLKNDEIGTKTALNVVKEKLFKNEKYEQLKNQLIKKDNCEYVLLTSKPYPQAEKEKYWFGYRESYFEEINGCNKKYLVLGCRFKEIPVVCLDKDFLDGIKNRINATCDEEGNVKHYHIVLFVYGDKHVSLLLSKPYLEEIDVTEYIVKRLIFKYNRQVIFYTLIHGSNMFIIWS